MTDATGSTYRLTEDQVLLRDTLRQLAHEQIAPRAAEIDRSNEFPRDLWPQLGRLGLLGITVEEEFGGSGLDRDAQHVDRRQRPGAAAGKGDPKLRNRRCRDDRGPHQFRRPQ